MSARPDTMRRRSGSGPASRAVPAGSSRGGEPNGSEAALALARGLGWFSIGLGLAEVLAPEGLCRAIGLRGREALVRVYGLREIATGAAILASSDPTPWIWGRVAGDALDLTTLAEGIRGDNPDRGGAELALAAVAGVTLLDAVCLRRLDQARSPAEAGRRLARRDLSGFPKPAAAMRGAAAGFAVPSDFRIPDPLRPWSGNGAPARGTVPGRASTGASA